MSKKLAVILTPGNTEKLKTDLDILDNLLLDVDYEVIAVLGCITEEDYNWMSEEPDLIFAEIYPDLSREQKRVIGASMVTKDVDNLLFVDNVSSLDKEELIKHNNLFIEPLIGAIGYKGKSLDEFEHKKLLHYSIAKFNIDGDAFAEKCCDDRGNINYITPDYIMTSVDVWELIGGFKLREEYSYVNYCIRLQALGYTILPFND